MEPEEHIDYARHEAAALLATLSGPLDAEVPSCPGWTLADLLDHVGSVCAFWGDMAADPKARPGDTPNATTTSVDQLEGRFASLFWVLEARDPDQPCWTYGEPHTVRFVQRRIPIEFAIHRWDGQGALGTPDPIATDLAVDAIDEFLTIHLGNLVAADAEPVGGSVHLHPTDTDAAGEWEIVPAGATPSDGFELRPGHAKSDAAIRGTASDLLLALWRRTDAVEVLGDQGVAERFFAVSAL